MSDTILLVIDPQVGWQHEAVNNVFDKILAFAKRQQNPVILMKFTNPNNSQFMRYLNWQNFANEKESRLIEGYEAIADSVFEHATYGCLTPELDKYLREKNVKKVLLSGVLTDVCVTMTAMQLFDSDKEVFLLTDLVGTLHGEYVHQAALKSLDHILGSRHMKTSADY